MATLLDSDIDLKAKNTVKVAMKVGRFPLVESNDEWLDNKRRIRHKGVALLMKDYENGGTGYAELDLDNPKDKKIWDALQKVQADPDEAWRLKRAGIKVLDRDEVPAPLQWWDSAHWKSLLSDVSKGVRIMPERKQREAFIANCVRYEQQKGDKARQGLIDGLLQVELDGVAPSDPMSVPGV